MGARVLISETWYKPFTPVAVFLMLYATLGCASQLGYVNSGNLHGSERALFALVIAAAISAGGRRFFSVPTGLVAISVIAEGSTSFQSYPFAPIRVEQHYLSASWRNHIAMVDRLSPGGKIWSVYAGLPELVRGPFHPDFDYIIHALGPRFRQRYVETFQKTKPDLVRLDPLWGWGYGGWLLNENWPFYRSVFQRYEPAYVDKWGSLWIASGVPPTAAAPRQNLVLDEKGCTEIGPADRASVYCSAKIWMGTRIAASEIVPEGRFVASCKMLPLAVALLEASRSRSALPNAL